MADINDERVRRVKKNCEECLGEVSDLLWTLNGKFIWMSQKTIHCPQYVTESDLLDIKKMLQRLEEKYNLLDDCKRNLNSQSNPKRFEAMITRLDKMSKRIDELETFCEKLIRQMKNTINKNKTTISHK